MVGQAPLLKGSDYFQFLDPGERFTYFSSLHLSSKAAKVSKHSNQERPKSVANRYGMASQKKKTSQHHHRHVSELGDTYHQAENYAS